MVFRQPYRHRLRPVVIPLIQGAAAGALLALIGGDVIGGAAQGAHAPSADAGDQPLVGDFDVDDPIDVGDLPQGLRLGISTLSQYA